MSAHSEFTYKLAECVYHHNGRHIRRMLWPEGLTWSVHIDLTRKDGDSGSFFQQHTVGVVTRTASAAPDDVIAADWIFVEVRDVE